MSSRQASFNSLKGLDAATGAPIILDLCGGTGAWSLPYREAGYDVRVVTLPEQDARFFPWGGGAVHGILAAPPCTCFSVAGAWVKRSPQEMVEALSVVDACLRIVATCAPKWWALENPVGTLRRWIGPPVMTFQPYDYGDPWPKRTLLWGRFMPPRRSPVDLPAAYRGRGYSKTPIGRLGGRSEKTKRLRSVTPPGFARAFFEANP